MARLELRLTTGLHGTYQWLTTGQRNLDTLLRLCPGALVGKYVAVTSLDSGPLILNEEEISTGWESRKSIGYSPRVQSAEKLPHGGFDEWYVFNAPADLGRLAQGNIFEAPLQPGLVAAFVNFGGFGFHTRHTPGRQALADLFWTQLEWIQPESYIADGHLLNFVSRDENLFMTVREALSDPTTS